MRGQEFGPKQFQSRKNSETGERHTPDHPQAQWTVVRTDNPGENKGMADEDMNAELVRLRAENEALKNKGKSAPVSLKVSEKGGVSVYGLGRFPVTLYQEQWVKLLGMADEIRTFLSENKERLKVKGE